ncbi:MAG: OmpA family protein [Cocleimonas sp.]|nr:OmpA family protein [Cocleimonas sp.]
MSKDKDSTTLQEYFISGIVILFFGLLYLFLSNDFNFGSSKDNLLPTLSVAQTATSTSNSFADNEKDKPAAQDEANRKATDTPVSKENSDSAPKDSAQVNAASPKSKDNAASQQVAAGMDASPEKEAQEPQQLASADTVSTAAPQSEESESPADQAQAPAEETNVEAGSDEVKGEEAGTSPDSGELIYKLPDGRSVEIAKEGFENNFKKAILSGSTGKPIVFDRVYFDSGSSELRKQSDYQIQATAALLHTHKAISVAIRGHSDNRGSSKKNSILSLLRGGSMKKALADLGIDPKRIHIEGLGDQEPIASNKTKRGRRNNRRIDLVIKK